MLAEKLAELKPGLAITIVEAGEKIFDFENRMTVSRSAISTTARTRGPAISSRTRPARGVISRTMAVGGSALHWGGVTNRFSAEDLTLKSRYGLGDRLAARRGSDLERHYCEAERRLGVSGEPGPLAEDRLSEPYPMARDAAVLQPRAC